VPTESRRPRTVPAIDHFVTGPMRWGAADTPEPPVVGATPDKTKYRKKSAQEICPR
jgi:hypothetical protein